MCCWRRKENKLIAANQFNYFDAIERDAFNVIETDKFIV